MASCTLAWHADKGFELDVEVADDDVALRLAAVPIPADGTEELRVGVELDKLDILFKAHVEIEGESGQVQEARVQLVDHEGKPALLLEVRCEDVETGEIVPFKSTVPFEMPSGVPAKGGPRPVPTNEDELDWDDETTLEQLIVNAPETPITTERQGETGAKGLQALLSALASLDEDDAPLPHESTGPLEPAVVAEAIRAAATGVPPKEEEPSEPEEGDQSMAAGDEARGLLEILVNGEHLEIEDGHTLDALIDGTMHVLALPLDPEAKATRMSTWLLDQDAVADLFIGDEELAEILERW